jgi:hypothetical protein
VLGKQRLKPNFGNAGSVNTILTAAVGKAVRRPPLPDGCIEIRVSDIDDGGDEKPGEPSDPMAPLDKLYRYFS